MNIQYFFQDSNDNTSIKTLFENHYQLEDIHKNKKNKNEKALDYFFMVIPIGLFTLICGLIITFIASLFIPWLKEIFDNHTVKFLLFYFFLPSIIFIMGEICVLIAKNQNKNELDKKLKLFYHEDTYIPILKQLDIFNDLSDKGKQFLVNLNNKELTQSDISYIVKKYDLFSITDKKIQESNIINNIKNKVLDSTTDNKLEVGNKLKFFNQKQ